MNTVKDICRRIVGGGYVYSTNAYPYMATIWYLDGEEFKFKSGATYIGKRYFLTAAHCTRKKDLRMMLVRMGDINLKKLPKTYRVVKVHTHPNFNSNTLHNDIAIIEVDKDVNVEPVRLVCEHLRDFCYNYGVMVKVLGFGKDCASSTQQHLMDMKEVDLKIKPIEESRYHRSLITGEMFLAGNIISGKIVDACTGDSGGPCLCNIKGKWVLVGIVSWGSGCGKKDLPGVYTKVISFLPWIRSICKFGVCNNHDL